MLQKDFREYILEGLIFLSFLLVKKFFKKFLFFLEYLAFLMSGYIWKRKKRYHDN